MSATATGDAAARAAYERARRMRLAGRALAFLVVLGCAILFVFPVYWMAITSLKSVSEVFRLPPVWWPAELMWGNYPEALAEFPVLRYAENTLRVSLPVTIGTTLSSALVAYGFSRLRWRGRDVVFYLVLATLMIPTWVTLLPLYLLFDDLGWINTYRPLVVPSFFGDPFSIFLLRQFFLRQPQDLVDAARVDGASHLRVFAQIILPLSRPALAVVALFSFIYTWTDFFDPLIYLSNPDKYTLQLGLFTFFAQHFVNWPGFMAASVVVLAPIVVIFFLTQKTFIEGITFTGLRG
ncbi:MAG: carbohydrate ABC transporter permease [Thermomicrobiales bacterium]|nr:carbohydrate ABC transporter permease [Thermomicrobiales bacterium]